MPAVATNELFDLIFAAGDCVLIRPIEIWHEDGKRKAKNLYKSTDYVRLGSRNGDGWIDDEASLNAAMTRHLAEADKTRANSFFGVCPRFANKCYDEAWAIRCVRTIWADLDDITVDDALAKVNAASLAPPSAVVSTGGGVHLYWALAEPYLIDDVGDPPPLRREFRNKKLFKYIEDLGTREKMYFTSRQNIPQMSPKALHVQDVMQGMAAAIGGDSTFDLARLLRIPGTLNRKDQKIGREPIPCQINQLDAQCRYDLSEFERYRIESPQKKQRENIAKVKLPAQRKVTPARVDILAPFITRSSSAPVGQRSDHDFALICAAIERGWAREKLWHEIEGVGKFAESGERYFELTWDAAEMQVREKLLAKAEGSAVREKPQGGEEEDDDSRPTVVIFPSVQETNIALRLITDVMAKSGQVFCQADQAVFIDRESITAITDPHQLAAVLNEFAECKVANSKCESFVPLPPSYARTWLGKLSEIRRLPEITCFTRNPIFTHGWRLVEPGYDRDTGIYYAGPIVSPADTTDHIDRLLAGFCFKSDADRANYLSLMITAVLVTKFGSHKPAGLFMGNQPSLGKSTAAQMIGVIRDGEVVQTLSYNPNDEELEKRLGTLVRHGATTIIVDNAKGSRQGAEIDSPVLERSITDPILSFRLLGFSGAISAPNTHLFLVTANSPRVSRDLVTRCIPIELHHEGSPFGRRFEIEFPEEYVVEHRAAVLGELLGLVQRWVDAGQHLADTRHRFTKRNWDRILGGILRHAGHAGFLANVGNMEAEIDPMRDRVAEFVEHLWHLQTSSATTQHWAVAELIKIAEQYELLQGEITSRSKRGKATQMGTILSRFVGVPFLAGSEKVVLEKDRAYKNQVLWSVSEKNDGE